MKTYRIASIPGDGIGQEITERKRAEEDLARNFNTQAALNAIVLDSTRLSSKIYEATIALGIYSIGKSPVLGQQQFALESEIESCTNRLLASLRSFGTEQQKRK